MIWTLYKLTHNIYHYRSKNLTQNRFTPIRISNAPVTDIVGDHKSESPYPLITAHAVMVGALAATESVLNEKRCNKKMCEL